MAGLFASGHVIDAILVLVACEAVALAVWGRGRVALRPLLFNLASGAALMLAVRGALTGAPWWAVATCLFAACLAHATELGLRLIPSFPDPNPGSGQGDLADGRRRAVARANLADAGSSKSGMRRATGACEACGKPFVRTRGTTSERVAFPSHELK